MTSLKLKELIFTAIQAQNYPIFDEVELQEDILNAVKEWLKQKHAKESNKERMHLLQELFGELEK